MSEERHLIDRLRSLARHPAARGLADDAAVLPAPLGRDLVLTHDMLVEGVHYLPGDPPGDVAWKLLAVNLSDLAAKGAEPIGVLMGFGLTGDGDWDAAFVAGLARALDHFAVPLLGGDTVAQPRGDGRVLGLTAIGQVAPGGAPDRRAARAGDLVFLTGPVGDAGLGLRIARGALEGPRRLLKAYRLPMPRLAEGRALAPLAHAMADVSDGLLIDAARIAAASGLAVAIDLDAVPLSDEARGFGADRAARLAAATAGDDYQLIAAVPPALREAASAHAVEIGRFEAGTGLRLHDAGGPVPLPAALGFEHGVA
ncbi:thiamine-phosphate kinase [Rhizorhabdus dicambivorans]|uniref:Thiamine-monophosphate kinase n=1 Tax=Rhizorhabdus dicambivorans TaxID=1850238 RepID=A0A2A4G0D7_9SPHN|nr:thiamine-phosphate kinase [Rhizorhabdus dicambivorans]ATE63250.1 thiamine-phosphate kinase [Rhizorhabdus dicambivorans]PCE43463.1 thiamine-phosphate kinase [Rhizorhabdus dicambivorans]